MTTRLPLVRLYDDEVCLDGFAGGGGTSKGIEMVLGRPPDFAINHDAEALAMHEANHPQTTHIRSNIRKVNYAALLNGKRCGFAWFSPDCTYFSKAKGGQPFRDRNRARRIRGLAWEAVRFVVEHIRATGKPPRMIFIENVEEFQDWCPLGRNGQPDEARRGQSFRQWVGRLRGLGGVVEWRALVACDHGSPTKRKRLFVIIRFDGQPIVWPEATHGPKRTPYRTAAECIDFTIPVPSIFLNKRQAKAWGKAYGLPTPRRPLARATLRRIARGVERFVLDSPQPFIIKYHAEHGAEVRGQRLDEPIRTLDTSNRFALVTPFLAAVRHHDDSHLHSVDEPIRTIPSSDREFALVAPTPVNTRNGERRGQAPRAFDIQAPYPTVTAVGSQGALVAAFLAKHNGGHEATGQKLTRPVDTITVRENKALVTSHLMKLKGTCRDGQPVTEPIHTVQAQGNHYAEVRAFLVKYFGSKKDGRPVDVPLDTITTKERYGLVTVTIAGEEYAIVDIGMRMLTPRELFLCQGFPPDYKIDHVPMPTPIGLPNRVKLTKRAQTRLCGNSVPPHVAAALIAANHRETTTVETAA